MKTNTIDRNKLADLRRRAGLRHAQCYAASQFAIESGTAYRDEMQALRHWLGGHLWRLSEWAVKEGLANSDAWHWQASDLAALPSTVLKEVGLTPAALQPYVDAQRRAEGARADAAAIGEAIRPSQRLMARIDDFAARHGAPQR